MIVAEANPLVHNIETSTQRRPISYRKWSIRINKPEVMLSHNLYRLVDERRNSDYAYDLSVCRTKAWFVRNSDSGLVRVRANHCNLRWCPLCARSKSWIYSQQLIPWLNSARYPKFLTLTAKHREDDLRDQIDDLYDAFKRLRRRSIFKKNVFGGVWFFQIVKSSKTQAWHPHIHILIDSKYIKQQTLSDEWLSVTGDSFIVDIRAVKDKKKAIEYASRYVARPMSLRGLSDTEMLELFDSFHNRRLCGAFGSARGISFNAKNLDQSGEWVKIGTYESVMRFVDSDSDAAAIYSAWINNTKLDADIDFNYIDDFIANNYSHNKRLSAELSSGSLDVPPPDDYNLFN